MAQGPAAQEQGADHDGFALAQRLAQSALQGVGLTDPPLPLDP